MLSMPPLPLERKMGYKSNDKCQRNNGNLDTTANLCLAIALVREGGTSIYVREMEGSEM